MIHTIEITFPVKVELPDGFEQELSALVDKVCKKYERENPDRVMWPAEHGFKITYMPWTEEEEKERGMEFDESVYHIGVCERTRYGTEK